MFGILTLLLVGVGLYVATSSGSSSESSSGGGGHATGALEAPMESDIDKMLARADVQKRLVHGTSTSASEAVAATKEYMLSVWNTGVAADLSLASLILYGNAKDVDAEVSFDKEGAIVGMVYTPIVDDTAPLSDESSLLLQNLSVRYADKAVGKASPEKATAVYDTIRSEKKKIDEAHSTGKVVKSGNPAGEPKVVTALGEESGSDFYSLADDAFADPEVGGALAAEAVKADYRSGDEGRMIASSNRIYAQAMGVVPSGRDYTNVGVEFNDAQQQKLFAVSDALRDKAATLSPMSAWTTGLATTQERAKVDAVAAHAVGETVSGDQAIMEASTGSAQRVGVFPSFAGAPAAQDVAPVAAMPAGAPVEPAATFDVIDYDPTRTFESRIYGYVDDPTKVGSSRYKADPYTYV